MSLRVGRVTLAYLEDARPTVRRTVVHEAGAGRSVPVFRDAQARGYRLSGVELGAGAAAVMEDLARELDRPHSIHLSHGAGQLPAGYYELAGGDPGIFPQGGAGNVRPWALEVVQQARPQPWRPSWSDNVVGTDEADRSTLEGKRVRYVPTTSEVVVLNPRVASVEPLNLPALRFRALARVKSLTYASAKYRLEWLDSGGNVLPGGSLSQVTAPTAGAWDEVHLGDFVVPDANDLANNYRLTVQGVANELDAVHLDYVRFVPIPAGAAAPRGSSLVPVVANDFRWRGAWSSTADYEGGDVVLWRSGLYWAKKVNTNKQPSDATTWDVLVPGTLGRMMLLMGG